MACQGSLYRSHALTQSARYEACVNPNCGRGADGTVVWAHSNEGEHGKGARIKAHDLLGLYLCSECHYWYDQGPAPREEKRAFFRTCYPRTMVRVAEKIAAGELKLV